MVVIYLDDVEGQNLELAVRSNLVPFLTPYWNSCNHVAVGTDKFFRKDNIWARLFNIPRVTKAPAIVYKEGEHKYQRYCLTEGDLVMNRYPVDLRFEYEIYQDTGNLNKWSLIEKKAPRTDLLSIDCEMVETKAGYELARVTIINEEYEEIYDRFVKPKNAIINYHYQYSGIKKENLTGDDVLSLTQVQNDLRKIFDKNTILVGHSLENDLRALKIKHKRVIDTSLLFSTRAGKKLSLKHLAANHLKFKIQSGTHCSLEDAKAALALMKYKVDIIDKLGISVDSGDDRFFKKIVQKFELIILDEDQHIQNMLDYGIMYEPCGDSSLESISKLILKYSKLQSSKKCDFIFSRLKVFEQKGSEEEKQSEQERYKQLSDNLQEIYDAAPDDTLFVISTLTELKKKADQDKPGFNKTYSNQDYSNRAQNFFNTEIKCNSFFTFIK